MIIGLISTFFLGLGWDVSVIEFVVLDLASVSLKESWGTTLLWLLLKERRREVRILFRVFEKRFFCFS